jgi:hypothetical protein
MLPLVAVEVEVVAEVAEVAVYLECSYRMNLYRYY